LTARLLREAGVPFRLVVEPQEAKAYAERFGEETLLVLPFQDAGSVVPARNWIKRFAAENGFSRHWQLDDNLFYFVRLFRGKRIRCSPGVAMAVLEDFVDRYENVAIAGFNYEKFAANGTSPPPFRKNVHVYSCFLLKSDLPFWFRGKYNEDADFCLQALSRGWCTILLNVFLVRKARTMTMKGGNTDALYRGDGRLKMARSLERLWPRVVTVRRRFKRPQHVVRYNWRKFDVPLRRRGDLSLEDLPLVDEYGLKLVKLREPRNEELRLWFEESSKLLEPS